MNRPSILTRLMGCRLIALVLLIASGAAILGWLAGGAPWWIGVIALLTAMQTLSAVGQVRRHKAWAAKWQAMGEPVGAPRRIPPIDGEKAIRQNPASPAKEPRRGRLRAIVAALLALAIPVYVGDGSDMVSSALTCLWLAACLYLAFRILRRVMRRRSKRHEQSTALKREAETPFVTWVMKRPSSSPSRAEAMRVLPDYCVTAACGGTFHRAAEDDDMKLSDDMKRRVFQAMKAAHYGKAKRLLARLRICDWSLKEVAESWRRARAAPFLSIADAAPFYAEFAEFFAENADAIIAGAAGVAPEQIVVVEVTSLDGGLSICASVGEGPDAPALFVTVDAVGGAVKVLPLGRDRTWRRGSDGMLRLARSLTAAPEYDAS
jgi:hypothetical protein